MNRSLTKRQTTKTNGKPTDRTCTFSKKHVQMFSFSCSFLSPHGRFWRKEQTRFPFISASIKAALTRLMPTTIARTPSGFCYFRHRTDAGCPLPGLCDAMVWHPSKMNCAGISTIERELPSTAVAFPDLWGPGPRSPIPPAGGSPPICPIRPPWHTMSEWHTT